MKLILVLQIINLGLSLLILYVNYKYRPRDRDTTTLRHYSPGSGFQPRKQAGNWPAPKSRPPRSE